MFEIFECKNIITQNKRCVFVGYLKWRDITTQFNQYFFSKKKPIRLMNKLWKKNMMWCDSWISFCLNDI